MWRSSLIFALLLSALVLCPSLAFGQGDAPWTGILDPSRAIDWTTVPFTKPDASWTQCGTTIPPYAGSAATVNNAIASCGANHFVHLGTGIFSLSSAIVWAGHSNVKLIGDGPLKTIVEFTGNSSCYSGGCHVFMAPSTNLYDGSGAIAPNGTNSLAITGTCSVGVGSYKQGDTCIIVSNVGTDAPKVGTLLLTDQKDEVAQQAGWMQCSTINTCSINGGSNGRIVGGVHYDQVQAVQITAIAGNQYTISPGLYANNLRTSQSPGAWWNASSALCSQCGLENLTLDHSGDTSAVASIVTQDCYQCWVENVREIYSGTRNHIYVLQSAKVLIQNNYFYGENGAGGNGGGYGIDAVESSDVEVVQNIFQGMASPVIWEDASGTIVAYNHTHRNVYVNPNFLQASYPSHDPGCMMDLWEGNHLNGTSEDSQHGNCPTVTLFRNQIMGNEPAPFAGTGGTDAIEIEPLARGVSAVGNALGAITVVGGPQNGRACDEASQAPGGTCSGPSYHLVYESSPNTNVTANCEKAIYLAGWSAYDCNGSGVLGNDSSVISTMMRWGNYDTVHAAVQWNSSEVPTTGTTYLNALSVPANHNLPASLFSPTQPAWYSSAYGNPPWPAIHTDAAGGELLGLGGTVDRNPARLAFENLPIDSSYQNTYNVIAASWSSGTATITLNTKVGLQTGAEVSFTGITPAGYNVPAVLCVAGSTYCPSLTGNQVSFPLPSNPGSYVSGGSFPFPNILAFDAAVAYPGSGGGGGGGGVQALDFGPPTSQINCGVTTPNWLATHNYSSVKMWVQPNPANGHFYRVSTPGTSGGTQPSFNTGSGSTTASGTAVFTEMGTTNIKQCQDDVSLYVYGSGQLDGVTLLFKWSNLESSSGTPPTASGGYDFSSMDTAINAILNDPNFPASATVGVVFTGISAGSGPNNSTPAYVFSPSYATSVGAGAMPTAFCSSPGNGATYPGDGLVGTDTVYVATNDNTTDTTGYPWTPSVPYKTAWEAFQDHAIAHISASSYHSRLVYQRVGVMQGGEVFPHCINLWKTFFGGESTAQIKTTITNYANALYTHEAATMAGQTNQYPLMAGVDGTCVPVNSACLIGYDWADAEAGSAAAALSGFGSQGLTQSDTTAFNTFGFADGGTASSSGTYCAGNQCYLFHQYPSEPIHEMQTLAASCPQETTLGDQTKCTAGSQQSQTGSLINILPLMKQINTTHIEIYNQDWLCAFDPNYLPCAPYAASYAAAISTMRAQSAPTVNLTESQPTTDSLVTRSQYHRQMSETLTESDALARQHAGFLALSQGLSLSDAIARQFTHAQAVSQILGTSDALVANLTDHTPSLNESVITSDALVRQAAFFRSLSENLTTSDALARQFTALRSLSQSLTTSDALTRQFTAFRNLSQALSSSDALVANFTDHTPSLNESAPTVDGLVRHAAFFRLPSETLTTSDALARTYAGSLGLSQVLSTADTVATLSPNKITLAEPMVTSDVLVRQFTGFRSPSQALSSSDALVANFVDHTPSLNESSSVSDTLARNMAAFRSLSENIPTSDALARSYTGTIKLSQTVILSDTLATVSPHRVGLSEPLSTSDALVRQFSALRAASDSAAASDSLGTGQRGNFQTLSESVSTSDVLLRQFSGSLNLADSPVTTDGLAAVLPIGTLRFLVDVLNTGDSLNRTGSKLPAPPVSLRVTQQARCSLLVWRISPSTTAVAQNLYRSPVSGQFLAPQGSLVTGLSGTTETYTDCTVAPGQTYFYAVTASSLSAEGGYSNQVQTTVPSGVSAPSFLSVLGSEGAATLVWQRSPTIGITSQIVYRSAISGGPYTAIQTLEPNTQTFRDFSVLGGQYFYVVGAQMGSEQSPYSNEVTTVIP